MDSARGRNHPHEDHHRHVGRRCGLRWCPARRCRRRDDGGDRPRSRPLAFLLPGVEDGESDLSLPGARGLWPANVVDLARPEVLGGGREFAHIHPDGSLHVWLPVERAAEVDRTKWGVLHPWVGRDGLWDGVVMVYTPETPAELDVSWR